MTNKELKNKNKENNCKLIIVRGLPGCGKSTFAEYLSLSNNGVICCADDFFIKDGEYNWNSSKLGAAHNWCKKKCEEAMKNGKDVILSNTSTKESEFKPYVVLANKYGYMVFSTIVENRHNGENIHKVPEETISRMEQRFQIKLKGD
jgi:predicted kinase